MVDGPFSLRIFDERGIAIELLHPRRKVAGVEDGFCGTPKIERSQNLAAAYQRVTNVIVRLVELRKQMKRRVRSVDGAPANR